VRRRAPTGERPWGKVEGSSVTGERGRAVLSAYTYRTTAAPIAIGDVARRARE
jgi:hypothetical protein